MQENQQNNPPLFFSFSQDGSFIATSGRDSVFCFETATGHQVFNRSTDQGQLIGWITPTQLALTRGASGDGPTRIATLDVQSGSLKEAKIYTAASVLSTLNYLRGGRLHINGGNMMQVYDRDLRLERTLIFDRKESSTEALDLELTEIISDGRPPRHVAPLAVVLTDEGQQTMRYERFIEQYPAAATLSP